MQDSFGRTFRYLRLSLTQKCNFRCSYCLPEGSPEGSNELGDLEGAGELSVSEITRLVSALAELGVSKVRLTGGEPTVRPDFLSVVRSISAISGIGSLGVTTNGYRLEKIALELMASGITAVNVSVDSLNPARFLQITGQDRLRDVLRGIDRVLELGFAQVKINVVLLKGCNDDEVESFLSWTKNAPVCVRFIELMRTGDNARLFSERHIPVTDILERLRGAGWVEKPSGELAGPAKEWGHSLHAGSVGVISPYSHGFCESCNRLRVTSQGALRLCLFGEGDHCLRPLLQRDSQREQLKETIQMLMSQKPLAHLLHEGRFGNVRDLARIGG